MCMGPPRTLPDLIRTGGVYPHVYGATHVLLFTTDQTMGLSPCVWGHRLPHATLRRHCGAIPRCMGPPPCTDLADAPVRVCPHGHGANAVVISISCRIRLVTPC